MGNILPAYQQGAITPSPNANFVKVKAKEPKHIPVIVTSDDDSDDEVFQEIENDQTRLVTDDAKEGDAEEVTLVLNEYLQFGEVGDVETFEMLGETTPVNKNCALLQEIATVNGAIEDEKMNENHSEEIDQDFVIVNENIGDVESMDFETTRSSEELDFVNGKFQFHELVDFEALQQNAISNDNVQSENVIGSGERQEVIIIDDDESENVTENNQESALVKCKKDELKPNDEFTCIRCGFSQRIVPSRDFQESVQTEKTRYYPHVAEIKENVQPANVAGMVHDRLPVITHKSKPSKQELFKCFRCAQTMETLEAFKSHMLTHKSNNVGRNCDDVIVIDDNDESESASNVANFQDAPIPYIKPDKLKLNRLVFRCLHCGKPMDTLKEFRSHMFLHERKIYECTVCRKSYRRQCHLSRHINLMH